MEPAETPSASSLLANDELLDDDMINIPTNYTTRTTPGVAAGIASNFNTNTNPNITNHNNDATASITANTNTSFQRVYPVVEVIAPETLSGGYTFDVEYNHEVLTVKVPSSGIFKGQKFQGQTMPRIQEPNSTLRIPLGGWKDSLFDFCTHGPVHPSICLAVFCPLIAIGQLFTRLGLSWTGSPNANPYAANQDSTGFKIMVAISVVYFTIFQMIKPDDFALIHYLHVIHFALAVYLAGKTRTYIRSRYDIPANDMSTAAMEKFGCGEADENGGCGAVEDYAVACLCHSCTVSQMTRHTAMYETYEGSFFSSNGLPRFAPNMV